MEAKSKLFSRFDLDDKDNEPFRAHLRATLDLSAEQRDACIEALPSLRLAQMSNERDKITGQLADKTGLTHVVLGHALNVMQFFLNKLIQVLDEDLLQGDDSEKWAQDLIVRKCMSESERSTFIEMVNSLSEKVVPKVRGEVRRREFVNGVLPCFRSFGTTVEMRAVLKETYDWLQPYEDYSPEVLDVTPVVSMHIGLNRGTPSDVFFQVEERDLDLLINSLEATKKELFVLREFLTTRHAENRSSNDVPNTDS